ncbi:cupin domain-containing protein [Aquimarina sp. 2201CG1-2-11]|uniref:cupin domain-containing protein n=1 Tax=Aquimarina discodermiae TaxID=3231043 RepID=UPI0034623A7B
MSILAEKKIDSLGYQSYMEEQALIETVRGQVKETIKEQMLEVLKDFFPYHPKWDSLSNYKPNNAGAREIRLAKTLTSWNGNSLPRYPTGNPEITILKYIVQPGTKLDIHKHPVISAGYIIKGELVIISEANEKLHLKTGDSFVELVDTWHFGQNESEEPVEIVVFYAGVEGTSITTHKEKEIKNGHSFRY